MSLPQAIQQLLIFIPGTPVEDIEKTLAQYGARSLGRFDEAQGFFSSWEFIDSDLTGECELHTHHFLDVSYLAVRESTTSFSTELRTHFSVVSAQVILEYLRAPDDLRRRQGLWMTELMPMDFFLDAILQLCEDPDTQINYEARRLVQVLTGFAYSQATPETLFSAEMDSHDRRQLLRWIFHTSAHANANIDRILDKALGDADWEVRITAIIMAVRYQRAFLAPAIARVVMPDLHVVDKRDAEIAHAIQHMALLILSRQAITFAPNPGIKQQRMQKLYQLLQGINVGDFDYLSAWFHYFLHPHPGLVEPPPAHVAIQQREQRYFLGDSQQEMVWIPGGDYVLGEEGSEIFPLRKATIIDGFYISKYHCVDNQANLLMMDGSLQLQTYIETLSQTNGARICLPDPVQWQMAVRGHDGRKYPWGWGRERVGFLSESPWGVAHCTTETGELCIMDNDFYRCGKIHFTCGQFEKTLTPFVESGGIPMRVIVNPQT